LKTYRRSISVNGREIKSPRFLRKSDADRWYEQKQRERQFEGLQAPVNSAVTLNYYFDKVWLPMRESKYPISTTYSDRQRFNDYVRPAIGPMKVSKINQLQVRKTLANVVDKHGRSTETRNRVRALLSKLFNDAMNEEPALRTDNPAMNISFNDPRQGKKQPEYIKREQDIISFIKAARELSSTHLTWAAMQLMAGMRKSEAIPLTWSDFDSADNELRVSKRFMQAANRIVTGTKAGSAEERIIPIPDALARILKSHRKGSDYNSDSDFILVRGDGLNYGPRDIHTLHMDIVEHSGIKITPHGLRHTFGREWVKRGGSMKALQAILGHANSSVTDLYSKLAGKSVSSQRNTVNFEVEDDE
jgi:integrase